MRYQKDRDVTMNMSKKETIVQYTKLVMALTIIIELFIIIIKI